MAEKRGGGWLAAPSTCWITPWIHCAHASCNWRTPARCCHILCGPQGNWKDVICMEQDKERVAGELHQFQFKIFFHYSQGTMQIQSVSMDILTVSTCPASYRVRYIAPCCCLLHAWLSLSAHLAKKNISQVNKNVSMWKCKHYSVTQYIQHVNHW